MERCLRPGCHGEIQDGFCANCGMAPVGVSRVATIVAATAAHSGAQRSLPSAQRSRAVQSGSMPASSVGSAVTGSRSRSTSRSTTNGLGAGFISLPPPPSEDPLQKVLASAVVPERKCFCGSCQKKVTRESGFCPFCGKPYSFEAALKAGDLVGGQYEVKGPIAFGGFGWIYLAQDTKLKKRWVVLKGLLNSKDAATAEAALQEREFLSAVKHPNIVSIYNFVTHGTAGYIVMEYVSGKSLGEIRKERGKLPPAEAIAYILRVLSAFQYLEDQGLAYCDFKPPNAMVEDDVKLIDMGGVRRVIDAGGNVYGTQGFFAPEIGEGKSPTFVSDLYTVARTLAVLIIDFDFQHAFRYLIPGPNEEMLFAAHDSLYRFLLRATHKDPELRFQSAGEMSEQLLGVLRDVVAGDKPPRTVESSHFCGDAMDPDAPNDAAYRSGVALLPALKIDVEDPAANNILGFPSNDIKKRLQHYETLLPVLNKSMELKLRLADACITVALGESGATNPLLFIDRAEKQLDAAAQQEPFDWRVWWYRGKASLAKTQAKVSANVLFLPAPNAAQVAGTSAELDAAAACKAFDRVYGELPGELGAKLGLAIASEKARRFEVVERQYELIVRCDPNFATACFGLARCRVLHNDREAAAAALSRVPNTSNCYVAAQMELARVLIETGTKPPTQQELSRASDTLKGVGLEGLALHKLRANLLVKAVAQLENGTLSEAAQVSLLDVEMRKRVLRFAAEKEFRACARYAKSDADKIRFVNDANAARPMTLV